MELHPILEEEFEFVNFPVDQKIVPGVYLIGNVYVGASKDIYRRMLQHYTSYRVEYKVNNIDLAMYFNRCLSEGEKVKVTYLAFDPHDEAYFSMKHRVVTPKGARFYHNVYQ